MNNASEDYSRLLAMLTRRKQFQAGEIPEQPKMTLADGLTVRSEEQADPDTRRRPRAKPQTLAALLIQTETGDEI